VAKLDAESSGYGLSFVVLRFDGEAPPVARFVEVIVRTNQDHEGAVRRQDTAAAGDFAVRCVGHPRFDAVAQAPLAVGNLRGKGDGQLALRVELAGLLEDLLAGVIVALAAFFLHRKLLLIAVGEWHPVAGRVHDVDDSGARDGFPKVVASFDFGLNGLALENERQIGIHAHFVFGLLVFLDVEASLDLSFAGVDDD